MTVATTHNRNSYSCDGSTVIFPYTFKIFEDSDLEVLLRDSDGVETTLTLTTDYTVSGAGDAGGGNVTTVATYASGNTLVILRQIPLTQLTDYVENDPFLAATHEEVVDRAVMLSQQIEEVIGRGIRVSKSSPLADADLEITGGALANKVVGFDAAGTAVELKSTGTVINPDFYVISDYTDLADAISTIGSSTVTLLINSQVNVTDDATVPANIELWFLKEGSFNISAGKIVTINGGLLAGLNTIFTGSGTVVFGDGFISEIYPQWWGALGDDSNDDTTAIQAAITASYGQSIYPSVGNKTVRLITGVYKITAELLIEEGIKALGDGCGRGIYGAAWDYGATRIKNYGTANNAIRIEVADPKVSNQPLIGLELKGFDVEGAGSGATSGHGIYSTGDETLSGRAQTIIEDVSCYNHKDDGFKFEGTAFLQEFNRCYATKNGSAGLRFSAVVGATPGQTRIRGGLYYNNVESQIKVEAGGHYDIYGPSLSDAGTPLATTYGLEVTSGVVRVWGGFSEGNAGGGDVKFASSQGCFLNGFTLGSAGTDSIKLSSAGNQINSCFFAGATKQITIDSGKAANVIFSPNTAVTIVDNSGQPQSIYLNSAFNTGTSTGSGVFGFGLRPITHNGQNLYFREANTLLNNVSGATVDFSSAIPNKGIIIGVTARITTALGTGNGTTGFTLGDQVTADLFGTHVGVAVDGTLDLGDYIGTAMASLIVRDATLSIRATATGGNFDGTGAIRISVFYIDLQAPTS